MKVVAPTQTAITASNGRELSPDDSLLTGASVLYDATLVIDGEASVATLIQLGSALHWVNETYAHCKALGGLGALLSFLFGAMCSTIMINISRRRHMHSQYALPPDATL